MNRDRICTAKNMARISTMELVETQILENQHSAPDEIELEAFSRQVIFARLRANQRARINRDILYHTFLLIFCLFSFYFIIFFLSLYFYT